MEKVDLKKELKHLYQTSAKEVVQVDVPTMNYLMVDGEGDPNTSQAYSDAVEALFMVSYAVKFMVKKGASAIDYGVMPLEGLWWADDMSRFTTTDKSNWKWTMMIMQPSFVTPEMIDSAIADVTKKRTQRLFSSFVWKSFRKVGVRKSCILARSPKKGRRLRRCICSLTAEVGGLESIMKFT
jgi:hypothetical protein